MTLNRAGGDRGKFQPFLLGSLQPYLKSEAKRSGYLKRGGGVESFLP